MTEVAMERSAPRRLGAAVLGLRMGRRHLEGYQQNHSTEIVAVCDPDAAQLRRVKEEFSVPVAVTDYRELLDIPDIHVVSVASPDYCHAEQAIALMQAGNPREKAGPSRSSGWVENAVTAVA